MEGVNLTIEVLGTWFYEHPYCTDRDILLFLLLLTNVLSVNRFGQVRLLNVVPASTECFINWLLRLRFIHVETLTILIHLLNDGVQLLSGRVLTQHPHHLTQLLGADVAAAVRVKHVEGRLELWEGEGG